MPHLFKKPISLIKLIPTTFLVTLCLLNFAPSSKAQFSGTAKNTLYLEIGGNAYYYSLNYDRKLGKLGQKITLGARIGIGGTAFLEGFQLINDDDYYFEVVGVPIEIYFLSGQKNHHLDVGIGIMPGNFYRYGFEVDSFLNLSYRYQPINGGFFFKSGLVFQNSHVYGLNGFLPYLKLGLGYTF